MKSSNWQSLVTWKLNYNQNMNEVHWNMPLLFQLNARSKRGIKTIKEQSVKMAAPLMDNFKISPRTTSRNSDCNRSELDTQNDEKETTTVTLLHQPEIEDIWRKLGFAQQTRTWLVYGISLYRSRCWTLSALYSTLSIHSNCGWSHVISSHRCVSPG